MLFGLTSPEMILSKTDRNILSECTLKTEYVNTYGTCGICGAAMRTRQELPAFFYIIRGSAYEEILKLVLKLRQRAINVWQKV